MPDGSHSFLAPNTSHAPRPAEPDLRVTTAQTIEDIMRVTAIRAAVYMAEQDCPYEEEFDGNDFCATHMIGWVGSEPVGCLRIRYFGGFAKVERVAVRSRYRTSAIALKLIRTAFEHCSRKGFEKVLGHVRDDLVPFYKTLGCRVADTGRQVVFSELSFTEMLWERPAPSDAISLHTDPYAIIRPEGEWDSVGVLEHSATRATGPASAAA
ncbi:MAG: GNAT family N-acetyltransferase [Pseudomonadota bacterium]